MDARREVRHRSGSADRRGARFKVPVPRLRALLETSVWKNRFLREYEDFTFLGTEVARDLAAQNILYAEAFYSPGDSRADPSSTRTRSSRRLSPAQAQQLQGNFPRSQMLLSHCDALRGSCTARTPCESVLADNALSILVMVPG